MVIKFAMEYEEGAQTQQQQERNAEMSRNDEESLLLSTNEAPEELKIESENRRTTVSVVTVLLSLIVTVATVSLVTMSGSGQPPIITENSLAADQTQLWSFPTFDSIMDVSYSLISPSHIRGSKTSCMNSLNNFPLNFSGHLTYVCGEYNHLT